MQSPTIILDFRIRSAWDRVIVQAIAEFSRTHDWTIVLSSPGVPLSEMIKTWNAAVVVTGEAVAPQEVEGLTQPLWIAVGQDCTSHGMPSVCPDDAAVGRLAAKHLLSVGVTDMAVFAYDTSAFAIERATAFRQEIMSAGGIFHPGGEFSSDGTSANFCSHLAIIAWLKSLPRHCGVFALCDNWAGPVATYCRHLGLRVPEDIALIGVDNDTLVCELSSPPLSSVSIAWREIAKHVVQIIERHLAGRAVPPVCVRIAPLDVAARRSTDRLSIEDRQVAEAVAWIRSNAHHIISVDDVVRAVYTYRQRLERQFRSGLGRTVMEEVRRAHIDLAKHLLSTTDLPMPDVASRSGFSNATILGVNFRKELGVTPSEYRRRAQGNTADVSFASVSSS